MSERCSYFSNIQGTFWDFCDIQIISKLVRESFLEIQVSEVILYQTDNKSLCRHVCTNAPTNRFRNRHEERFVERSIVHQANLCEGNSCFVSFRTISNFPMLISSDGFLSYQNRYANLRYARIRVLNVTAINHDTFNQI